MSPHHGTERLLPLSNVPSTVLTAHAIFHWLRPQALSTRYDYYHSHFTGEKTEAQRGTLDSKRHSTQARLKPGQPSPQPHCLPHAGFASFPVWHRLGCLHDQAGRHVCCQDSPGTAAWIFWARGPAEDPMRDGEHPLPRSPCIPTQAKGDDHLEDFVKTFSQTSGHLPNRPNPPRHWEETVFAINTGAPGFSWSDTAFPFQPLLATPLVLPRTQGTPSFSLLPMGPLSNSNLVWTASPSAFPRFCPALGDFSNDKHHKTFQRGF